MQLNNTKNLKEISNLSLSGISDAEMSWIKKHFLYFTSNVLSWGINEFEK